MLLLMRIHAGGRAPGNNAAQTVMFKCRRFCIADIRVYRYRRGRRFDEAEYIYIHIYIYIYIYIYIHVYVYCNAENGTKKPAQRDARGFG